MTLRVEVADLSLAALDALEADSIAALVGAERPLGGLAALLDWRLAGAVSRAILAGTVTPEHGEALLLPAGSRLRGARVFLFGLGDPSPRTLALCVRHACEALRRAGAHRVAVGLPGGASLPVATRAWVEAAAGAGLDRQVLLGDAKALTAAVEEAGRALGVAVRVERPASRVEPPTG